MLLEKLFRQFGREPVQTFVKTCSLCGAGCLNVPLKEVLDFASKKLLYLSAKGIEAQLLSQLGDRQGIWQILFVGENKNNGITQLVFVEL